MDKIRIMLLIPLIIVLIPVLTGCMEDDMDVGVGDGFTFNMDSMTRDLGEFDVRISLQVTISNEMDMDLSISHTHLVMTTSVGEELLSDLQIINKINITGNDDLPPSRTVRTSAIFRLDYDRIPLSLYLNYSDWAESGYTTVFSNDLELPEDFLLGEMVQYSPETGLHIPYIIYHVRWILSWPIWTMMVLTIWFWRILRAIPMIWIGMGQGSKQRDIGSE